MPRFFTLLLSVLLCSGAAFAEEANHDQLHVAHGWARASLGHNPNTAAYVTLHNPTETSDRLLSVACADAARCAVHNHVMDGNVMKMRPVETLEVAPGAHIEFGPGGYHIMMFTLNAPLVVDGETTVTFSFEHAGDVTVSLDVLSMQEAAKRSTPHQKPEHKKKHQHENH